MVPQQHVPLLSHPTWDDYELLDSGDGEKLERFGRYRLIRPETQAIWSPALPAHEWKQADAVFQRTRGDDGPGKWEQHPPLPEQWLLHYDRLAFWARLTPFRHTGVFPEHSAHWPWIAQQLAACERREPPKVLVLFGYTGLTTLFAARAGAHVCHVDASRPAVRWAQANQQESQLQDRSIRWIVDDVLKFVRREIRRGSHYDMIVMDPPVFGRGPKGEIWRLHEALPSLLDLCVQMLSTTPVGVLVHAYATTMSSVTLANVLRDALRSHRAIGGAQGTAGNVVAGELILTETGSARSLSTARFARWECS
jgi:23S rRNA (cytosine1962-C5)-methyltransferase